MFASESNEQFFVGKKINFMCIQVLSIIIDRQMMGLESSPPLFVNLFGIICSNTRALSIMITLECMYIGISTV